MRTFLVVAVLIALLAVGAESMRLPRDAEEGTVTKVLDAFKSYYDQGITSASGYLESIKGMKLEEKAKNLFDETTTAVRTYAGIMQDQLYHMMQSQ
ncbi:apolipoprotein C-II [Engraulis encrasicolus]|uniref:apolipoprotein C-II n=1 Tax=Engraulis encrasicolus TaxID=184585 RepID=UPI002FD3A324